MVAGTRTFCYTDNRIMKRNNKEEKKEEMGKIWFTSDLHLSHKLVTRLRHFTHYDQDGMAAPDTQTHDDVLAANWDAVIKPEDTVYVLGDMSINSGDHVLEWVAKRPGTIHLISGNHDKTHKGIFQKKALTKIERWKDSFASIQDELVIEIAGRKVTLSHFPYWSWGDGPRAGADDPNFKPRYENQRPKETPTSILIHGHTHTKDRAHGRQFHVGVDAWDLKPVPYKVVEDWVRTLD